MIRFVTKNGRNSLILFVHGFTGNEDTWKHANGATFPDLLSQTPEISDEYDIAYFSYYTKLTNLYSAATNLRKRLSKLLRLSHETLKKNISVEEIANLLRTEIRFSLAEYDDIIVIAHSMGGLVTKSYIVQDIGSDVPCKVKLFISLAVPHSGANTATFGSLVSNNLQIEDLTPLNEFVHRINDVWLQSALRPATKYFYGAHDGVVPKTSACPSDKQKNDVIAVDENHGSICKPKNVESTTFQAVLNCILEYNSSDPGHGEIHIQSLADDAEYNDELFVLKLIVADIHQSTIKDAKTTFLNAEYIRKKFGSASDRKRFAELYHKVKKIYQNHYNEYLHSHDMNSGQLLSKIHQDIVKEDRQFLQCQFLPFLHAIHKQGMLHQLANDQDGDVWWTEQTGAEFLKLALEEKGNG